MIRIFFVVLTLVKFNNGLQTFELELNEHCTSKTNETGICKHARDCARQHRVEDLTICSFVGKDSIVCCPKSLVNRNNFKPEETHQRISFLKCHKPKRLRRDTQKILETIVKALNVDKIPALNGFFKAEVDEEKLISTVTPSTLDVVNGIQVFHLRAQPHMSRVGWKAGNVTKFHCGGSLIAMNFVMTAAHCQFNDDGKASNLVRLGHDEDYAIKNFIAHSDYNFKSKHNDIGLIELHTIVKISEFANIACLRQQEDIDGTLVEVLGYGRTGNLAKESKNLQLAELKISNKKDCAKIYQDDDDIEIIESQICALDTAKLGRDTCQGDSGGPLQVRDNEHDDAYIEVAGITSFGESCGSSSIPGVYTKVYAYLDWIEKNVWPEDYQEQIMKKFDKK